MSRYRRETGFEDRTVSSRRLPASRPREERDSDRDAGRRREREKSGEKPTPREREIEKESTRDKLREKDTAENKSTDKKRSKEKESTDDEDYFTSLQETLEKAKKVPNPFSSESPHMALYRKHIGCCFGSSLYRDMNVAIFYAYDQDQICLQDVRKIKDLEKRRAKILQYNDSSDSFQMLCWWYLHYAPEKVTVDYISELLQKFSTCMDDLWMRLYCRYHLKLEDEDFHAKLKYFRIKHITRSLQELYDEYVGQPITGNERQVYTQGTIFKRYYESSSPVYQKLMNEHFSK